MHEALSPLMLNPSQDYYSGLMEAAGNIPAPQPKVSAVNMNAWRSKSNSPSSVEEPGKRPRVPQDPQPVVPQQRTSLPLTAGPGDNMRSVMSLATFEAGQNQAATAEGFSMLFQFR